MSFDQNIKLKVRHPQGFSVIDIPSQTDVRTLKARLADLTRIPVLQQQLTGLSTLKRNVRDSDTLKSLRIKSGLEIQVTDRGPVEVIDVDTGKTIHVSFRTSFLGRIHATSKLTSLQNPVLTSGGPKSNRTEWRPIWNKSGWNERRGTRHGFSNSNNRKHAFGVRCNELSVGWLLSFSFPKIYGLNPY